MKTSVLIILIFMVTILVFTSIALFQRDAWGKVQDYTPTWVDEKIFIMVVYLFLMTITASWLTIAQSHSKHKRYMIGNLYLVAVTLFYFVIFTMSEDTLNTTELIVLASLVLTLLILSLLSRQVLAVVPFLLYVYLFSIIYEIKNNSE